jgi:uncharacterized protein (TIGR02145 family)
MKKIAQFILVPILILGTLGLTSCEKKGSGLPVDGDGNEYDTVVIGTQVWLAENLKTSRYNNGISIPLVTDNTQWTEMISAAFCWYNNQPEKFKDGYGALYNWWAANVSYLCPVGYHVPNEVEWETLINYLGGEGMAGGRLKEPGTVYWAYPNDCNENVTGFNARGGGGRSDTDGTFGGIREGGVWWAFKVYLSFPDSKRIDMSHDHWSAEIKGAWKEPGMSVRCVKNK